MDFLVQRTVPHLYKVAMSGFLELETKDSIFEKDSMAVRMLIDILTDRGFAASYIRRVDLLPVRIDMQTGEIYTRRLANHVFRITFPGGTVRDVRMLQSQSGARCASPAVSSDFQTELQLRNCKQRLTMSITCDC
jgi:hypothetical protein